MIFSVLRKICSRRERVRVCKPDMGMEELEKIISFDASIGDLFSHDVLANASDIPQFSHTDHPMVLISDLVPHSDDVRKAIPKDAHVIIVDSQRDNLETINRKIGDTVNAEGVRIGALAVLAHAEKGKVILGTDKIDLANVQQFQPQLEELGKNFAEKGQLQLFGCSVAGDVYGQGLVEVISVATHTDVFASTNATGYGPGKDWTLEYATDPSKEMQKVIDTEQMAALPVDLAAGDLVITKGTIGPISEVTVATLVNLNGAFSVTNLAGTASSHLNNVTLLANPIQGAPIIWADISVDENPLFLATLGLLSTNVDSSVPRQISITGATAVQATAVLGTLQGTLNPDVYGNAQILIYAQDTVTSDGANDTLDVLVSKPPKVMVPGSLSLPANSSVSISPVLEITGSANDATDRVTLSATHGEMSLFQTTGLTFITGTGVNDSTMVFTGTVTNINAALNGMTYSPSTNYAGTDTISITANDQSTPTPGTDTGSVAITVTNTAPTITLPNAQGTTVNTLLTITPDITVTDAEAGGAPLRVTMSVSHGTLTLATTGGLTFLTGTGTGDTAMQFTGTLAAINTAVKNLNYNPSTDYGGTDSLSITVNDQIVPTPASTTATLGLTVINTSPVVTVPTSQTMVENTVLTVSPVIWVYDVDTTALKIEMSSTYGTMTLFQTTGLTMLSGTGTNDNYMLFTGSVTDINSALKGMTYTPTANWYGTQTLKITADDMTNPTPGTDTKTVAITVAPIVTPVAIDPPTTPSVPVNLTTHITGLRVTDSAPIPAAPNNEFVVTLAVGHGTLKTMAPQLVTTTTQFQQLTQYTFADVSGSQISFRGAIQYINVSLAGLMYTPEAKYMGGTPPPDPDTLYVTVVDPSSYSASGQYPITITNDPPTITPHIGVPASLGIPTAITGIVVGDTDIGTTNMTVTLSVSYGALSTSGSFDPNNLTKTLTINDTLANVNSQLSGLQYVGLSAGLDVLTITANDQSTPTPGTDSEPVYITVTAPSSSPPVIHVPPAPGVWVNPNVTTPIADISIDSANTASLTVTLSASHGTLTVQVPATTPGTTPTVYTNANVTFTDTLANINTALAGMKYTPTPGYAGATDIISITAVDQSLPPQGGNTTATIDITVNPIVSAPPIIHPDPIPGVWVNPNVTTPITGISITDMDAGSTGLLTVNVFASHGTLTVQVPATTPGATPVTYTNANVTFTDTLANINTALAGLKYTPTPGYAGATDIITITAVDQNLESDAGTIAITVNPSPPVPLVISLPPIVPVSVHENLSTHISDLIITEPGLALTAEVTVTMSVSRGTLTTMEPQRIDTTTQFQQVTEYKFVEISGSRISFRGPLQYVNISLGGIMYTPDPKQAGSPFDTLYITAIDPSSNRGQAEMVINVINDDPMIAIPVPPLPPPPPAVVVGIPTVIPGITVGDSDIGTTNMAVTLSVSYGKLNVTTSSSVTGNGTSALTINDTLANVNALISGLQYTGIYTGADILTITANDQSTPTAGTDSATVNILVTAPPPPPLEPPIVHVTTAAQTVPGNSSLAITGITITDADIGIAGQLTATLSVLHGTVTVQVPATPPGTTPTTYTNSIVTFTDTLANVNTALAGLLYTPTAKYDGTDTLSITAVDQSPTPGSGSGEVDITVTNVAPAITAPGPLTAVAGTPTAITGISVADPDIGTTNMAVTLSVSHGLLAVPSSTNVTGNGTSTLTINDTLTNVNIQLSGLQYMATATYSGSDTLMINANDQSTPTPGTDADSVAITVNAVVNAPPDVTVPGAQSLSGNSSIAITGISVSDADIGTTGKLTVTLSVLHGTVTVQVPGTTPTTYTNSIVTFTETLANVNTALAGLIYTPTAKYDNGDILSITAVDQSVPVPLSDTGTVAITVTNVAPTITAPATANAVTATATAITGISLADPDIASTNMSVTLSVSYGVVNLPSSTNVTGNGTSTVIINDTLANVNTQLSGLRYTSNAGYTGLDTLSITANDLSTPTAGTDAEQVQITVSKYAPVPSPSPAVINAPSVLSVNEDTAVTVQFTPTTPVSVEYADSTTELRVTLTANNGYLTLGWKGHLTSYTGDGTTKVNFTGPLNAINNALSGLKYAPVHDYFDTTDDTLTIRVNDQAGQITTKTVALNVYSVNDPPVISVPSTQDVGLNTPKLISGVSVADPDVGTGSLKMNLGALHGTLSVTGVTASANIAFTDTLTNVNTMLSTLSYTPVSNYQGPDWITITANDQGNSGAGGAMSDTKKVTLRIGNYGVLGL